jgi:hypothetical protein
LHNLASWCSEQLENDTAPTASGGKNTRRTQQKAINPTCDETINPTITKPDTVSLMKRGSSSRIASPVLALGAAGACPSRRSITMPLRFSISTLSV